MLLNCDDDKFWGQHLILNCKAAGTGNQNISDLEKVREFVDDLVNVIDMEKHGEIKIDKFGEGKLFGISFCQFIKTSSIVGHLCDENKNAYFDIFSCKPFMIVKVVECVQKWFDFESIQQINLHRGV
jgi:S-adenosylmethionine/arginine decarboxylase-like enzyme